MIALLLWRLQVVDRTGRNAAERSRGLLRGFTQLLRPYDLQLHVNLTAEPDYQAVACAAPSIMLSLHDGHVHIEQKCDLTPPAEVARLNGLSVKHVAAAGRRLDEVLILALRLHNLQLVKHLLRLAQMAWTFGCGGKEFSSDALASGEALPAGSRTDEAVRDQVAMRDGVPGLTGRDSLRAAQAFKNLASKFNQYWEHQAGTSERRSVSSRDHCIQHVCL